MRSRPASSTRRALRAEVPLPWRSSRARCAVTRREHVWPPKRCSPEPGRTGLVACISSISPAVQIWRIVPVPRRADVPAIGCLGQRASATWMPSVTKWKTVPPSILMGAARDASARRPARGRADFAPPSLRSSGQGPRMGRTYCGRGSRRRCSRSRAPRSRRRHRSPRDHRHTSSEKYVSGQTSRAAQDRRLRAGY